jgi:4-hydroxy-tetrahydrodipicolinate reductase
MAKKLKIALIGYGKMGKMIEQIAIGRGHEVVCKLSHESNAKEWKAISKADVAIEFTKPDSAIENIKKCFALNIPVVVGTTGWYEPLQTLVLESICFFISIKFWHKPWRIYQSTMLRSKKFIILRN